jgi:hypothetical protein
MGSSQRRAIQNYRNRLSKRGPAWFEVLGRDTDRELIRSLARRLAEDPQASRLRAAVSQSIAGAPPKKGGILAALRRSPLVGSHLKLAPAPHFANEPRRGGEWHVAFAFDPERRGILLGAAHEK